MHRAPRLREPALVVRREHEERAPARRLELSGWYDRHGFVRDDLHVARSAHVLEVGEPPLREATDVSGDVDNGGTALRRDFEHRLDPVTAPNDEMAAAFAQLAVEIVQRLEEEAEPVGCRVGGAEDRVVEHEQRHDLAGISDRAHEHGVVPDPEVARQDRDCDRHGGRLESA